MYYLLNILKWLRKIWTYKILRRQTHGVRVILQDGEKVFLVKHPYDKFWVFPGGGIEKDETPEQAARREIIEEAPYEITGAMRKLGAYTNTIGGKNDIVHVFVSSEFTAHNQTHRTIDAIEIQQSGWFNVNNLPEISKATQQRIEECRHGVQNINAPWVV